MHSYNYVCEDIHTYKSLQGHTSHILQVELIRIPQAGAEQQMTLYCNCKLVN